MITPLKMKPHPKKITPSASKMITSSTLENDNIQAFKNDIYTMKNDTILYTKKL